MMKGRNGIFHIIIVNFDNMCEINAIYSNGKLHGKLKWKSNSRETGISYSGIYKNGILNGQSRYFDSREYVCQYEHKFNYKNGKANGICRIENNFYEFVNGRCINNKNQDKFVEEYEYSHSLYDKCSYGSNHYHMFIHGVIVAIVKIRDNYIVKIVSFNIDCEIWRPKKFYQKDAFLRYYMNKNNGMDEIQPIHHISNYSDIAIEFV